MAAVKRRSPADAGLLVKGRREELRLAQEGLPGVSSSTVRKLENGTAEKFRRQSLVALAESLGWPPDAWDRLLRGEDPATWPSAPSLRDEPEVVRAVRSDDALSDEQRRLLILIYRDMANSQ